MNDHNLALLRRIAFLSDLPAEEIAAIASRVRLATYRRGEVILHEEDTNAFMYMVLQGEVKVFHTTEDGREAIVAFHGTGDSFGEISLIDQQVTPATVAAMEDSLVALVSKADFFDILTSRPKVLHTLLATLTGRLRHAWSQIRMLHGKDAARRVRALLQGLLEKRGEQTPEGMRLTLRLTHQNIADMTGLTRETVTRVIDRWKQEGWIEVDDSRHMLFHHAFFEENPAF